METLLTVNNGNSSLILAGGCCKIGIEVFLYNFRNRATHSDYSILELPVGGKQTVCCYCCFYSGEISLNIKHFKNNYSYFNEII